MTVLIRVAVADDHAFVRETLRRYFEREPDLEWAGGAGTADEAANLVKTRHIDVLVLDLSMPGTVVLEALVQLRAVAPRLPIVVLSAYPADKFAVEALLLGASAYLAKGDEPVHQLLQAIRAAALPAAANDSTP